MTKVIAFVEHSTPYAKGDVAGFENEKAEKYIEDGVAVEYKAKKEVEKKEEKIEEKKRS